MGVTGLEQPTSSKQEPGFREGVSQNPPHIERHGDVDQQLAQLVAMYPSLPAAAKSSIQAIITHFTNHAL